MRWILATEADIPLLARMNHRLIADEGHKNPMSVAELAQRMRGWLAGEYSAVLFEESGEPVAYALFRDNDSGGKYLRQFFVERWQRRRGVGRCAMQLLMNEVLPETRIVVEVLSSNERGRQFWHALGFTEYALTLERG
jgi:predicted GNAT family acetyltransferase